MFDILSLPKFTTPSGFSSVRLIVSSSTLYLLSIRSHYNRLILVFKIPAIKVLARFY